MPDYIGVPLNAVRESAEGRFNIRAFGAVCDGVFDDTGAFQQAITAASTYGGKVIVPGPTRIRGVTVRADNVWIEGVSGYGKILLDTASTSQPAIDIGLSVTGDGSSYRQGCGVRDLEITHLTGNGLGVGIYLHDAMGTAMENVYCHDLYDGLLTNSYIHTLSLTRRSRFSSNARYGAGIVGDNATRKIFFVRGEGARFEDNGSHGLYYYCGSDLYLTAQSLSGNNGVRNGVIVGAGDGIHVEGTAAIPCESISLHNGDADSNMGYNIYFLNVHVAEINGYWSGGAGGQGRSRTVVPTGSINAKAGVYFDTVQDASIIGVRAFNNSVDGISLHNSYGITLGPNNAQENGTWNNTANKNGAGVRITGANSFVTLQGVNCASGPTWDGNQDYGFYFDATAGQDILVCGCIAYNNAVSDCMSNAPSVFFGNNDFGNKTNMRMVRGTGSYFEFYETSSGSHKTLYSNAAPTGGTWALGDMVYNTAPAVAGSAGSQYVIHGWICTAAGTPGTWTPMRTLTGT